MARSRIVACVFIPLFFSGCSLRTDALMKSVAEVLMMLSHGRTTVSESLTRTEGDVSIYEGTNDSDTVSVTVRRTHAPDTPNTDEAVLVYTDFSYVDEPARQERLSGTLEGTVTVEGIINSNTYRGVFEVAGFSFSTVDFYYTFEISSVTNEITESFGTMKTDKGDFDIPEAEAMYPNSDKASWHAGFF